jgi:hypothetical protein
MNIQASDKQEPRRMLSISAGNLIQATGVGLGCIFLWLGTLPGIAIVRVAAMIAGYLLVYFSSHSSIHYLVGRLAGIRFSHYSLGGSAHAASYPPGIRQIFERLPFFAVHSDPQSLKSAGSTARACMFASGILGTALFSSLAALFALRANIPGAVYLMIFNVIWQSSSLISEGRPGGDLGKAARALKG